VGRNVRLALLLLRRRLRRSTLLLWRFSTWVWLAAGALVGFEVLELVLTGLLAAPEFVPLLLLVLALIWLFRRGIRRTALRLRLVARRFRARGRVR
jgi:hypothetical protein